jgi:hypothetical protein
MCLSRMSLASSRASAKPCQRDQIELLVDIERSYHLVKLLLDGVARVLLEHIHLAVVCRVGARVPVGGCDLLVEFASLDDDIEACSREMVS